LGKLRVLSGRQVCDILTEHGFVETRRRGSHVVMQYRHDESTITVPVPNHKEFEGRNAAVDHPAVRHCPRGIRSKVKGPMPTNTKTAPRRALTLRSLDDLAAELDRIDAAIRDDAIGHTGNWTPGQIMDHCAKFVRCAIDGFEARAPWFVRAPARLLFKRTAVGPKPIGPGFQLPRSASSMLPTEGISDAEGCDRLRTQVERLRAGEKMTHPSPLLGPLAHDEWLSLQLKHCDLHLGFISLGEPAEANPSMDNTAAT